MSFVVEVSMRLKAFFFLPPATATALRSTIPVRTAATGRPNRGTRWTRGRSASIRATAIGPTASTAGSPFVQF